MLEIGEPIDVAFGGGYMLSERRWNF